MSKSVKNLGQLSKSDLHILHGRGYQVENLVGEGSYAKVYQCKRWESGKPQLLACKVIDADKAPANFAKKFLSREIDVLTKISHPHIIHLYSMLHKGNKFFIFMRLAEKGDLLEFILKKNHIGERMARIWSYQLSLGLEYLHEMGIVHRDIKTENVLLTASNNAKLSDFGFSRYIYQNSLENLCQTHCGSMPYTAPEVLRGRKYDARKSDMWSLGVVIYVMLNKKLPFAGSSNQETMVQRQIEKRIRFDNKASSSPQYRSAVLCLLEPDIFKRWSASQLLSSAWILQDDRLQIRSRQEKESLTRARLHKEKAMMGHPYEEERKEWHKALAGTSVDNDVSHLNPGVTVIRKEHPASYTSVWRDNDTQDSILSGISLKAKRPPEPTTKKS